MTMETNKNSNRLIHIGRIDGQVKPIYFFLRQKNIQEFIWTKEEGSLEVETNLCATTIQEALLKIKKQYKIESFRFVNCGFRYTLPERDEHGINALFFQMKASYNSSNGVYFDELAGNNCHVQFASDEAKELMRRLT